ncbi:MAG TPA: hypothetical protein VGD40_13695 [Chryseosolibacter sp.]
MKPWMLCLILSVTTPFCGFAQSLTLQTFSSGGTSISPLVSTVGQPIASSPAGSGTKLEAGFAPSITAFANNFPPAIIYSVESTPIHAGDKLTVTVTDADGISKVTLFRRVIASSANTFDSIACTATTGNQFESTIQASHFDDLGIEYFFKAVDNTGKRTTKLADDGKYFHRYKDAEGAVVPSTVFNIGDKSADYKIITIPYNLQVAGIGSQFNELGEQEASVYRLATYAGNSKWNEYPSSALNVFERGKGYWFLTTKSDATLFLEGESTPHNYRSNLFQMTLQPDWNQVGNPYPVAISWNDVIEYNDNVNIGSLKVFNGGYSDGNELKPFEGGFVRNSSASPITISIPFKGQTTTGGRTKNRSFETALDAEQWMVKLNLVGDHLQSQVGAIGMHPDASNDIDVYDDFYPPRFSNYLELHFVSASGKESLAKNIVSRQESFTWNFTIDSPDGTEKVLQWDNMIMGTSSIELYLLDESQMLFINMRQQSSHRVKKGRPYKIVYGKNIHSEVRPSRTGLGKPYPNPFHPDGVSELKIPFGLADQQQQKVTAEIVDAQGRIVRTVLSKELVGGFYEIPWNGHNAAQGDCSSGLYLIRLTVENKLTQQTFYHRFFIQ